MDALLRLVPALKVLVGLLIATVLVCALYLGRGIVVPVALAGFLAFLLDPAVSRLKRIGLPRSLAVGLVALIALGALAGAGTYLTWQLRGLSQSLPTYQDTLRQKAHDLREKVRAPSAWDGAISAFDTVQAQISSDAPANGRSAPQRVVVESTDDGPLALLVAWMERVGAPAATAAIVGLFVILILLDRDGLRDRALRLTGGGNLHLATDALQEAGQRIGRYLRMQVIINASYGIPMALGLWLIGVPGALLWGALATVLRFVPYIGPLISAVCPLLLAFVVDPGWSMVLWTLALILALELVINNVVEPWLYGASTGLSTLSLIVAAMFWTSLWGPVGLVLSTPLTVCLLVLGRYVPSLRFFEPLLGTVAVLDPPQRLYQRLLADDVDEVLEMASERIEAARQAAPREEQAEVTAEAVLAFYDEVAVPALRLASSQHLDRATAQHRLRLATGVDALLEDLQAEYPAPPPASGGGGRIYCVGARWEVDSQAARMAAHALALHGIDALALPQPFPVAVAQQAWPALQPGDQVCLSCFHPQPQPVLRQLLRRLRRQVPEVEVLAATWALAGTPGVEPDPRLELQASVSELRTLLLHARERALEPGRHPLLERARRQARAQALAASGVLDAGHGPLLDSTIRQAAHAFDVRYAQVTWFDGEQAAIAASLVPGEAGTRPPLADTACLRVLEEEATLVIPDTSRDPRVCELATLRGQNIAFYAGTPLEDANGQVLGCLAILDDCPRQLAGAEIRLLERLARELMQGIQAATVRA